MQSGLEAEIRLQYSLPGVHLELAASPPGVGDLARPVLPGSRVLYWCSLASREPSQ